ncbi:MAG: VWA domain-containing protein [Halothiobacillaceae bacterium]
MITFAHPWLLLALPVVLGLGWRWRAATPAAFSRAPATLRHPALARLGLGATRTTPTTRRWLLLVLALLVLAAARPQSEGGWLEPTGEGRDILLVIDASPSMAIHDMTLDGKNVPRMAVLKEAARGFIDARVQDRLGLIVFSDAAATVVPLTFDRAVVAAQLARLTPGNTGAATAIGEGLGMALRQIKDRAPPPAIVLFTDGDNTGGILRPREALAYAQALGLHLYSIAVTPEPTPPTTDADGLREPTLAEMSELTGGAAYRAGDADTLARILAEIDRREATILPPPTERAKLEWYPIPLGLALLLLALGQLHELRTRGAA